jgi:hypothetical protein
MRDERRSIISGSPSLVELGKVLRCYLIGFEEKYISVVQRKIYLAGSSWSPDSGGYSIRIRKVLG